MSIINNPLVSIIVPVYNMEELLPKCLDSILNQTYENIELVIVDDGSSDNSGAISDRYAQQDNRVRVIHQHNQGIASALNTGLDNINGPYFLFVDSDDYISPDMVQHLLSVLVDEKADIVQCDRYFFPNKNGIGVIPQQEQGYILYSTNKEILDDFFHHKRISRNLAARLFKTTLFNGIRCEPGRMIIDAMTLPRVLVRCNKYVFLKEKYYYVYEAPTSASRSKYTMKKWDDCRFANSFLEGFIKEKCPEYIEYVYYKYVYTSIFAFCAVDYNKKEPKRMDIMSESVDFFKKYYPIFLNTEYYNSIGAAERTSFSRFDKCPHFYSKYTHCRSYIINLLRKVKYWFKSDKK